MDAYGNMSAGQIRQILSWFDAAENWAGSTQNMGLAGREKRLRGTKKRYGFEYFIVAPGSMRSFIRNSGKNGTHAMQPGVYKRTITGFGGAIKPILIYVKRVRYQPLLDFETVARDTANAKFQEEFAKAVEHELLK